jgi:alkylation response protein AidB-like acyl-CoA dehydrogenase
VGEYLASEVAPRSEKLDAAGEFPRVQVAGLAGLGLAGMLVPAARGGAGLGAPAAVAVIERIASTCPALAWIVASHGVAARSVAAAAGDGGAGAGMAGELIPRLVGGEALGCVGVAESDGGFLAPAAGECVVGLLLPRETAGEKVIVPLGPGGAAVEPAGTGLGLRAVPLARVIRGRGDRAIPAESRERPRHHRALLRTLVAAQAVGVARGALEETVEYARRRKQFGKPIGSFQPLRWYLAEMRGDLDAAAALVRDAALALESDPHPLRIASEAKVFATEMLARHARKVVQMHGGYGFDAGTVAERAYRDAKAYEILGGANQDLKDEIAGLL